MKSTQLILALAAATLLGLAVWQLGGADKAPAASEPLPTTEAIKAQASGTETGAAPSTATTDTAQLAVQSEPKAAVEAAQKMASDTTENIAAEVQSSGIPSPDAPLPPPAGAEPMKRTPAPGSGASSTPVSLPPPPKA
ncbi:hypothetical protein [Shewanella khirikhana]|uniref:hypothetical protein n=1 Tax=Shewanella khirikhana TaxID=1965282 RepID=UPI000F7F9666|nr:hypothetical protein [Shewanella khirikhana]